MSWLCFFDFLQEAFPDLQIIFSRASAKAERDLCNLYGMFLYVELGPPQDWANFRSLQIWVDQLDPSPKIS